VRPPPLTALQDACACAFQCFHEARERLDEDQWSVFVAILVELAQREAARLAFAEALRATRKGAE
jgi:hypothetical protein